MVSFKSWKQILARELGESSITGPLYKTLLERPGFENYADKFITGPLPVSVSKINQWVAAFIVFSWLILIAFSTYKSLHPLALPLDEWIKILMHMSVILITFFVCVMMFGFGKTHKEKHSPRVVKRETKIR